ADSSAAMERVMVGGWTPSRSARARGVEGPWWVRPASTQYWASLSSPTTAAERILRDSRRTVTRSSVARSGCWRVRLAVVVEGEEFVMWRFEIVSSANERVVGGVVALVKIGRAVRSEE